MNYIYDVLLNFNIELWDFYEWDLKDNITHIRRIPLFKINKKSFSEIINNEIIVDQLFLEAIHNKTEVFSEHKNKILAYTCLFTNEMMTVAYMFNKDGRVIGRSSMLIDEEEEAMEMSEQMNVYSLLYQCGGIRKQEKFKTYREVEMARFIEKELVSISNVDKLRYLYYECFNEKEEDEKRIVKRIKQELKDNWEEISNKIYNFFKVTSINK